MAEVEVRTLHEHERDAFLDLMHAAFDERDMFQRYLDTPSLVGPEDTWVAVVDGRIVSAVQIFDKQIRLNNEVVSIGGIGSVATLPEFERRGLSTRLLERAIVEMKRRGHLLSLLFTMRISFYQRLDWVQIPAHTWSLSDSPSVDVESRPFRPDDLPRIERIYDYYNLHAQTAVVRDHSYWLDQLTYAGMPDEQFLVATRARKIRAYARRINYYGIPRIMEHGCAPDGRAELARLLVSLSPKEGALLVHRTDDPQLARELHSISANHGLSVESTQFGDTMWRILDRDRAMTLAGCDAPDGDLLRKLVGGSDAVFWASDRF